MLRFIKLLPSGPGLCGGICLLAVSLLAGCNNTSEAEASGARQPPPPEVLVEQVKPRDLVITSTLPGRIQALRTAEVRARVEGIIQQRRFTEGGEVKAGDVLFQIDPAVLQADLDAAKASLARARADRHQANLKQQRFENLLERKAVSQQQYDEAFAVAQQAEADVAAAVAAVAHARIALDYASVRAPISGRIGRALVTEGALVGKNEATHLATIQQLDPIYVNFTQSAGELLRLRQTRQQQDAAAEPARLTLLMEDGTPYPETGKLLFSEMVVDPGTGEVLLRAELPNPDRLLLPGMFVRVSLEQAQLQQALTVPQRALLRDAEGDKVLSVQQDGKVVPLPVTLGRAQGDRWVIREGLQGGEQIIVEGLQKARPGATVRPVTTDTKQQG